MNQNTQTEALKVIFSAILKAQSKGIYTLEESSIIHKHMKVFFPKSNRIPPKQPLIPIGEEKDDCKE